MRGFRGIRVIVRDTKDLTRKKFNDHLKAMIGQTYELMATTDGMVPRGEMTKFEIIGVEYTVYDRGAYEACLDAAEVV